MLPPSKRRAADRREYRCAGTSTTRLRFARHRVLAPALAAGLAAIIAAVILIASRGPALTQFSVILHGTALAPGASGRATLTKTNAGWRVNLTAHGLSQRKQNGTYYQAWLKNQAGDLVPIGTFNQPADITMWSGVSPQHGYTTLTVTRQHASMTTTSSRQTAHRRRPPQRPTLGPDTFTVRFPCADHSRTKLAHQIPTGLCRAHRSPRAYAPNK